MGANPDEFDSDKNDPDNKKAEHEGWNSLQEKKRSCTDTICILVIVMCWVIMTIVGFIACGVFESEDLPRGNPARLINPMDSRGRICGFSSGVKSRKYGYYFPDTSLTCVSSCPSTTDYTKFICRTDNDTATANSDLTAAWGLVNDNECFFELATSKVLSRCIIDGAFDVVFAGATASASNSGVNLTSVSSYPDSASTGNNAGYIATFMADMYRFSGYIFGFGLGVSALISFIYLYFLRLPAVLPIIIWGIIIGVEILLVVAAFTLWSLANTWTSDGTHTNTESSSMLGFSYVVMGLAVLYLCLIMVLGKRVNLAISVVKEAARALGSMPVLIFTPLFQLLGITIFLVPWCIYVLYLASSGVMKVETVGAIEYRTFEYGANTKYAFLYMLFTFFWTSEFLVACGQLLIALSIAVWYFTKDKSTIGNTTVVWASKALAFNHVGTAAFGSLVIAIILTIRAIISYLQRKAKKSKNKVMEYILCCIQCCMWCLEKCMRFLNKNAYIMTAVYGYSFCRACKKAFFLLLRNILRVAAVNMVGDFVLLLGKLFIPTLTTFILYLIFGYAIPSSDINGLFAPLIFTFLLAYFVAVMFTEIFGMCIETILICFIADEEMFAPEQRFADGGLKTTMQKTAQANAVKVAPATEVKEGEELM